MDQVGRPANYGQNGKADESIIVASAPVPVRPFHRHPRYPSSSHATLPLPATPASVPPRPSCFVPQNGFDDSGDSFRQPCLGFMACLSQLFTVRVCTCVCVRPGLSCRTPINAMSPVERRPVARLCPATSKYKMHFPRLCRLCLGTPFVKTNRGYVM